MPYCTWEEKLHKRVTHWYKVLHDSGDSVDRVRNLPFGSFFGGEKNCVEFISLLRFLFIFVVYLQCCQKIGIDGHFFKVLGKL